MTNLFRGILFSFIFLIPGLLLALRVVPNAGNLALISKMDYQNEEVKSLRSEIRENLLKTSRGDSVELKFRKYVITKSDTFFTVLAKTMLDHDTISSVNRLASLWDIQPGSTWLIPNARGIAVEGSPESLAKKYNISIDGIKQLPGSDSLYFVTGKSFDATERSYLDATVFMKPVRGTISSRYGVRTDPFTKKNRFHKGVDIACRDGSPVMAAASGKIIYTGNQGDYGNLVIIEHENGYRTVYGHLSFIKSMRNQFVKQGENIALSGHTGKVTGPHLHFEVRRKGLPLFPKIR